MGSRKLTASHSFGSDGIGAQPPSSAHANERASRHSLPPLAPATTQLGTPCHGRLAPCSLTVTLCPLPPVAPGLSLNNWAIGGTALFYWALGYLPFKDGFYSSTQPQAGGQTVGPELRPDREILIAVLSGAMVGAMDGMHLLNRSRVLASCRSDGVLLKPDAPITTADECFRTGEDPSLCFVYTTQAALPAEEGSELRPPKGAVKEEGAAPTKGGRPAARNETIVRYAFVGDARPLTPRMVGLTSTSSPHGVYNWYTGQSRALLPGANTVEAGYEGHSYAMIVPLLCRHGDVAIVPLGEVTKYVPLSRKRVASLQCSPTAPPTLRLGVHGAESEVVSLCALRVALNASGAWLKVEQFCRATYIGPSGSATAILSTGV